ncbi:sensor histidine kinase [Calorimonas adulescens]|uniref:sensor histidine kinase n=1 Tax=Calorimonas adulescens TaxID=2606906 RepID=UPI001396AFF4|nr:sensor histidine kinase [Calorimonas adulescens]
MRSSKLARKVFIYFIILIVPSLTAVGFLSAWWVSRIIDEGSITSITQTLSQANKNVTSIINETNDILFSISMNRELQQSLDNDLTSGPLEQAQEAVNINRSISYPGGFNMRYRSFEVFAINKEFYPDISGGGYIFNNSLVKDSEWYKEAVKLGGNIYWRGPHRDYFVYEPVISAVKLIKSVKNHNKPLAVASVDIGISTLRNILGDIVLGKTGHVFLVDRNNNILFHNDPDMLGKNLDGVEYVKRVFDRDSGNFLMTENGVRKIVLFNTVESTGWKLIGIVPYNEIGGRAQVIKNYTMFVGLLCILLAAIFAYLISVGVTRPMNVLIAAMKNVESGDLDVRVDLKSNDEISTLGHGFNSMIERINSLIREVYETNYRRKEAELAALQAQINPHFLYNVLDSINWMAMSYNAKDISLMVTSLAKVMRYSLSGSEDVLLKDELKCIESYLNIQRIRYGDKFDYTLDFQDEIMEEKVPKFILQPLVENAIIHGIEPKKGPGRISIKGMFEGKFIKIVIKDDGVGMSTTEKEEGIGIRNVRERIRLKYGEAYGLLFESKPGEGTNVTVLLPGEVI